MAVFGFNCTLSLFPRSFRAVFLLAFCSVGLESRWGWHQLCAFFVCDLSPQLPGPVRLQASEERRAGAPQRRDVPGHREVPGRLVQGHVPEERHVRGLPRELRDTCFQVRAAGQRGGAWDGVGNILWQEDADNNVAPLLNHFFPAEVFQWQRCSLQAWVMWFVGCSIRVIHSLRLVLLEDGIYNPQLYKVWCAQLLLSHRICLLMILCCYKTTELTPVLNKASNACGLLCSSSSSKFCFCKPLWNNLQAEEIVHECVPSCFTPLLLAGKHCHVCHVYAHLSFRATLGLQKELAPFQELSVPPPTCSHYLLVLSRERHPTTQRAWILKNRSRFVPSSDYVKFVRRGLGKI